MRKQLNLQPPPPPTATKQRWQPASQVVQVKDLPAVEERFAPEQPEPKGAMNNAELLRTLNRDDLLSVVELLAAALRFPDDDFEGFEGYPRYLNEEVFDYLEGLTEYERLKLMSLIINTLIHEAEQSAVWHSQVLLPLKTEV